MLDYIRDTAISTHILNGIDHYPDEEAILGAIAYNDLILDDLIDYIGDGDEVMLLQQKTTTALTANGTANGALAADEVLYSIDKIITSGCSGLSFSYGLSDGASATKSIETGLSASAIPNSILKSGIGVVPYVAATASAWGTLTMYYTVQKVVIYP
jgi:hypothetical protein